MKRKCSRLAEVQLDHALNNACPSSMALGAPGAAFTLHLPEDATVAVPAGFDADELFTLLIVVREALR